MGNPLFNVNISKIIADAIGPGVLPAVLTKVAPGARTAGQLAAGTNPTNIDHACRGFIDDKARRNLEGSLIRDGLEKVVLVGDSISGGSVVPDVNDRVTIEGTTYRIEGVARDPAAATYTLSARAI